ncbi:MAG: hypothetical protein U1F43_23325 [Myxococcota bacterium]
MAGLAACTDTVVVRVLHRDNCNTCHQPLDPTGHPDGIEDMHPWRALTCAECHGGAPRVCDGTLGGSADAPTCDGEWLYDKTLAHPAGGPDLRGMTPAELDQVDPDWLRFVNPSDVRVLAQTCGRCHTNEAAAVRRSGHALQTGDLAIARQRSGLQPTVQPRFGARSQLDLSPDPSDTCAASAVTPLSPLPLDPASSLPASAPTTGNVVDQLLAKSCIGCHVSAFGPSADEVAPGAHRSSGCAACHVPYADDGLSVSGDPWVPRAVAGHPLRHAMEGAPRMSTCLACHGGGPSAGAQIGQSFQGEHVDWPAAGDVATPPDVHFQAGMTCIDCHGASELHGDGRIGGDHTCARTATACVDCHGTSAEPASTVGARHRLSRDGAELVLTTAVDGRRLSVPQLADLADKSVHDARHAQLACSTCHATWMPNCYGCHVDVDLAGDSGYLTNARVTPGVVTNSLMDVAFDEQILAWNARGEIQGAMPAERVFVTLRLGDQVLLDDVPRVGADGEPAFGIRPIDPHTTQRTSPFQACSRCHSQGSAEAPTNLAALDQSHGLGSERHRHGAYRLDAFVDAAGASLVQPGHAGVRPLSRAEIDKMRAVVVPDDRPGPGE